MTIITDKELEAWLDNAGDCIGGDVPEAPEYAFNAVFTWARRYLIPGAHTDDIAYASFNWSDWPTIWSGTGWLPQGYKRMPKGVLLSYFRWYAETGRGYKKVLR